MIISSLQQYLPFTVLKLSNSLISFRRYLSVATVLTVYGIETHMQNHVLQHNKAVATVLTVYGIETETAILIN